jgi:Holliday junction resolvase-like predicted endonuclease
MVGIPEGQRLNFAVYALREGADLERVCRALGWKEFEDLTALVLDKNEYRVVKHFRFKGVGRRYEIDVLGLKEPIILCVECKRWRQSWRRAATVEVVKKQAERTKALAKCLPEPKDRLRVAKWKEINIMSLVVVLSDTPIKMFDGFPVIPIFNFNSFLNEMQAYMDELTLLKVTQKSQESLNKIYE